MSGSFIVTHRLLGTGLGTFRFIRDEAQRDLKRSKPTALITLGAFIGLDLIILVIVRIISSARATRPGVILQILCRLRIAVWQCCLNLAALV